MMFTDSFLLTQYELGRLYYIPQQLEVRYNKFSNTKSKSRMMHSSNYNFAASNDQYKVENSQGQFNVMGNSNLIYLGSCQGKLNLMGNGNQIIFINCCIDLIINGNGNSIRVEDGEMTLGINGNNNSVSELRQNAQNGHSWSPRRTKLTTTFNNGNNNALPNPDDQQLSSRNRPHPNTRLQDHQPNSNYMMLGMMGMMGMANTGNNQHTFFGFPPPNQFYNPYQMQMHDAPSMHMNNPFQAIYESSTQNVPTNYNPYFNQSIQASRNLYAEQARRNQNQSNRRDSFRNSSNRNNGADNSRTPFNRTYRFEADQPRTRVEQDRGQNRRSRNASFPIQERWPIMIHSSDEELQEVEELPHFGPRAPINESRMQANNFSVRYSFDLSQSVPGLNQKQLGQLVRSKHQGKDSKCSICLDEMKEGNEVIYLFCFHVFHGECGISWLKKSATCPLCQLDLRPHLKLYN